MVSLIVRVSVREDDFHGLVVGFGLWGVALGVDVTLKLVELLVH
jgi:hypothetical protein